MRLLLVAFTLLSVIFASSFDGVLYHLGMKDCITMHNSMQAIVLMSTWPYLSPDYIQTIVHNHVESFGPNVHCEAIQNEYFYHYGHKDASVHFRAIANLNMIKIHDSCKMKDRFESAMCEIEWRLVNCENSQSIYFSQERSTLKGCPKRSFPVEQMKFVDSSASNSPIFADIDFKAIRLTMERVKNQTNSMDISN